MTRVVICDNSNVLNGVSKCSYSYEVSEESQNRLVISGFTHDPDYVEWISTNRSQYGFACSSFRLHRHLNWIFLATPTLSTLQPHVYCCFIEEIADFRVGQVENSLMILLLITLYLMPFLLFVEVESVNLAVPNFCFLIDFPEPYIRNVNIELVLDVLDPIT